MTQAIQPSGATRQARKLQRNSLRVQAAGAQPPTIGPWRVTRRLLSGGEFALFRAAAAGDHGPGCYVLKAASTAGPRAELRRALLQREALVAANVNHPKLISILDAELGRLPHFLVLPYLEGISLRRLMDVKLDAASSGGAVLPISLALSMARQVAEALAALHAAGWLHGQVRPEHVMVSPRARATLLDLSRCRRLQTHECDPAGSLPAMLAYAAPEMFSAQQLGAAADVYALGVVLFEALTGQRPFAASSSRAWAAAHRRQASPEVRLIRPDATRETSELIRLLLAKEPLRRPDAAQVVRWLAELEIESLCGAGVPACR